MFREASRGMLGRSGKARGSARWDWWCGAAARCATRGATSWPRTVVAPSVRLATQQQAFTTTTTTPSPGLTPMFSRLSQVARHFSRPLPNYAHRSAAFLQAAPHTSSIMAGSTAAQNKGLIHTAACLIIGDEVLGGKVRGKQARMRCIERTLTRPRR